MPTFELVRVMMSDTLPSGHIALDEFYQWPNKAGGDRLLLNMDTENSDELCREIDRMIADLEHIRSKVPTRFQQWISDCEK